MENTVTVHSTGGRHLKKKPKKRLTAGKVIGRIFLVLITFVLITAVGLYAMLHTICKGPSPAASNLMVSTLLETGALKFVPGLFFSEEEILAITSQNGMGTGNTEQDTGLITIPSTSGSNTGDPRDPSGGGESDFDINGVELIEIPGRTYLAKLLIINDPSRVKLATIYPWSSANREKNGKTLEELVKQEDCLAGINGGIYVSDGNWGGRPMGVVVCEGELQYNAPTYGDVLVGFDEDNYLIIEDLSNKTAAQVKTYVAEHHIRDAICFKDVDDGDENHFTRLVINGEPRPITGNGSGANPRTAIGQRADGAVLLLTTDGRGAAGHLGATAKDLIGIMMEYGAVNAANLDGGSSSAMYLDGHYEQTSVTLYYATSSWRLPTAFVVEKREDA